jgi:hypothetical protein
MNGNHLKALAAALFIISFLASACKKEERCSVHPEAFRFSIKSSETGSDLLAEGGFNKEDIGIYYIYNDERQDLIVHSEDAGVGGYIVMASAQLPMISLTGRSDEFFLVLGPEITDTLLVVVDRQERGDCDYHPYVTVTHNGKDLAIIEGTPFLLEK